MGGQILIFFSDHSFSTLPSAIDCWMKALRKAESVPRQTECLSEEDEELLWRKGLLGGDSSDSLRDTMVFMYGLFGNIPTKKCHILKIRKIHQEILYPSIVNVFQNVHNSQLLNSFLQSKKNFTDKQWYNNYVVGHNPLGTTVKRLCSAAGITGRKTKHSLHATAATRLF